MKQQKQTSFWNMNKVSVRATPSFNLKLKPIKVKPFSPVKLAMYPQRTPREIKMIDRKPWVDTDKDGVPNYFDCKPNNKLFQDFGPFRYKYRKKKGGGREVESFTAAERFGGANIKKLKKVGAGRDRVVYQLDKDKVLKIAKNPAGLRQNISESDLGGFLEQIKHYETGKDYVVMEKAKSVSLEHAHKLSELRAKADKMKAEAVQKKVTLGIPVTVENIHKDVERGVVEELNPDFVNYDFSYGDIMKPSSWGEKEGKPVLIDAGSLTEEGIKGEHRITKIRERLSGARQQRVEALQGIKMKSSKDFYMKNLPRIDRDISEMETELKQWNEVKYERQLFRKKGAKEEKKEIHPYTFQDTHQERIIHSDWKSGNPYAHVLEGTGDIFRESAKHLGQDVEFVDSGYINEKIRRIKSHIEDVERMKKEKVWDADYAYYKTKLEDPNAGIQMVLDSKRTESFRHFKKLAEKGIETGIHPLDSYEAAVEAHPEKINKMIKQWRKQPVQTKLQEAARQLNIAMLKKDFEKVKQIIPKIEEMTSNQKKALEPLKTTIELVKEEDRKLTELKYSGASEIGLKDIADAQARKESVNKLVSESLKNMKWDKKAMAFPPKKEEDEDKRDYKEVQKDLEGNIIQGQRHGNFLVTSAGNYIWRPTPEYRRETYKQLIDAGIPIYIANRVRSWQPGRVKEVIAGKRMTRDIEEEKARYEKGPKTPPAMLEYERRPERREHKRKVDKEVYHADVEKARATSREKYANNIDRKRFLKRKEYYMKKDIPNPTLLFEAMETSRNLPEIMKSMAVKESKIKTKTKPAIIIPEKKEEKISTLSKITRFFGFKGDKRAIALPGKDLPAQHHIGELKIPLKEAVLDERNTEMLGKPTGKGVTWTSTYTPKEEYPSDWAQFAGENLSGERGKGTYLIRPIKSAKIYQVKTEGDVKELRKKYGKKPKNPYGLSKQVVDWEKFSKDYDAIQMAPPALWKHRMDMDFSTYTWDVESTAFMRPVFRKIERIEKTPEGNIIKQQIFPETTTPQPKALGSMIKRGNIPSKHVKEMGYVPGIIKEIDAREFKEQFEKDQREPLAWNPNRLKEAKKRNVDDDYPVIYQGNHKVDVTDGRHRISAAAERGQYIDVIVTEPKEKLPPVILKARNENVYGTNRPQGLKEARIRTLLERERELESTYAPEEEKEKIKQRRERIMEEDFQEDMERQARKDEIDRIADDIRKEKALNSVQDLKEQEPSQDIIEDLIEKAPKETKSFVAEALSSAESMPEIKESMAQTAKEIQNE